MYLEFFGLREYPFALTPDTGFFFADENRRAALTLLHFALDNGEGFVKITGEVGTGKTTLCRTLLGRMGPEFRSAYILNPQQTPRSLLRAIAADLEVAVEMDQDPLEAIHRALLRAAAAGQRVVLLVDEAQTLSDAALESIRLLSNLETEKSKLIQIVLFGQPELDVRLQQPQLRQLRQRIGFHHALLPLSREESAVYLEHRLRHAGYTGGPLFRPEALRLLQRSSGGTPRLLNLLGHKSLLAAYGAGRRSIGRREVLRAMADTPQARQRRLWWRP
ncbi:ExeA family protein [Acidithiobacillus sp.]|uniref:ExeA family protein n=1 Tax=Acidithiobacillus sp. TaxID=1872118 RepID=UPI003CFF7E6F